jgi:hypothetical protein
VVVSGIVSSGIISVVGNKGVLEDSVRVSKMSRASIEADKVLRSIILIISL